MGTGVGSGSVAVGTGVGNGTVGVGATVFVEGSGVGLGSSVQDTAINSAATTMSPPMIQRPARCGLGQFMLGICNLPSQLG